MIVLKAAVLTPSEWQSFCEIINSSTTIRTLEQFESWIQHELQALLPHAVFYADIGQIKHRSLNTAMQSGRPYSINGLALPCIKLHQTAQTNKQIGDIELLIAILIKEWRKTFRPQLYELVQHGRATFDQGDLSPEFELSNAVVHGLRSLESNKFIYFGFFHIPEKLTDRHIYLIELLVPQLYSILLRILPVTESIPQNTEISSPVLTHREQNILLYIMDGKTNGEIAKLLSISSETVKTHTKHIFNKLKVNKRSQAVAKAHDLGLIA